MIDTRFPSFYLVVEILNAALYDLEKGDKQDGIDAIEEATALLENLIDYKG
jgi:hypothetical protein